MLPQPLQRIVAPEFVRVVYRSIPGFLSDNVHQFVSRDTLNGSRINPAIALQKAKYNAFTPCAATTLSLASAAKVALVHFNLARKFAAFQFSHMVDRFSQTLVYSRYRLIISAKIMRESVGRLRLVETFQDTDLSTKLPERLLFSTVFVPASHIATTSMIDLERTAENTLLTPQKVGLTTENILLGNSHKGILTPRGYEPH